MGVHIIKGDGTKEPFRVEKLIDSFVRSGAEESLAREVAEEVERKVTEGMSTTDIYRYAYQHLKKREKGSAARYSMRRAILELGPTGYPFEDFMRDLLRKSGYETAVRQTVPGKCATHEVDIIMEKEGLRYGAELKFHNTPGFKTDIKTALYVEARFRDIMSRPDSHIAGGWLVTNTKFTDAAIRFSECAGLSLMGWSYPKTMNISSLIKKTGIYPVTVLSSLSRVEKKRLLEEGVALCQTIATEPSLLDRVGITKKKHRAIVEESRVVCAPFLNG